MAWLPYGSASTGQLTFFHVECIAVSCVAVLCCGVSLTVSVLCLVTGYTRRRCIVRRTLQQYIDLD